MAMKSLRGDRQDCPGPAAHPAPPRSQGGFRAQRFPPGQGGVTPLGRDGCSSSFTLGWRRGNPAVQGGLWPSDFGADRRGPAPPPPVPRAAHRLLPRSLNAGPHTHHSRLPRSRRSSCGSPTDAAPRATGNEAESRGPTKRKRRSLGSDPKMARSCTKAPERAKARPFRYGCESGWTVLNPRP